MYDKETKKHTCAIEGANAEMDFAKQIKNSLFKVNVLELLSQIIYTRL